MSQSIKIRNIAVIGHSGEGKTSLIEDILFNCKAIERIGKIREGTTAMDYDEQEIARGMSIGLSVFSSEFKGYRFNLIDVPGFDDFEGEQVAAMRAADSALIVSGIDGSLSVGTEKALKYCLRHHVPVMIFMNGTDKENADYFGTLAAVRAKYPKRTAPIQTPIMQGNKMIGYINVLTHIAYRFSENGPVETEIPTEMKEGLKNVYGQLTEAAAESDDTLLEKFFDEGMLSREEVMQGVKKGIMAGAIIPILAGSTFCNKGVFNLMDEMIDILPAPCEVVKTPRGEASDRVCINVFKTLSDAFVGRMNLIKVIHGTLKNGDVLKNLNTDTEERITSIYRMKGKKQEAVSNLAEGEIGAVSKLSNTFTGDTLTNGNFEKLPPIDFPVPMYAVAISAEKSGEEEKLFSGLSKLMDEDKTLRLEKNTETGETLLWGMGETQIDVIISKLKSKFKVNAAVSIPKIAYRETIRGTCEAEGKHKKQSGGHGQYGHVKMRFEPYAEDFKFEEEVVGGSVPKTYIPAVEKGILENIRHGVLAGYPVVGVKAILTDGSYHDVDSSELAFKIAAGIAYKVGIAKARPVLLEPIYEYDITVPDQYTGDVMGDINKRRGKILGMDSAEDNQVIHAEVPESGMMRYAVELRSMTQGRGVYARRFARYEEVPQQIAEKIIAAYGEKR